MQEPKLSAMLRPVERFFAIFGALLCLIITIILWWSLGVHQAMWPLPALYFIEVTVLSILCAFLLVFGHERGKFFVWGSIGAMGGFSILGALSVGFFYLPVSLTFTIISIISDVRNPQRLLAHLGICLLAGIVQVVLMLTAIQLLYPSAVF